MSKNTPLVQPIDPWIQRYANKLKNMMGLSHWIIHMSPKPCNVDALGETEVIHAQNLATIYLHKDFRKDTPEDIRATMVHELLHCHMSHISEVVHEILKPEEDDQKGKAIHKATVSVVDYEIERIIDAISESLGKWMPTPDMPKTKTVKPRVAKKAVRKKK